MEIIRKEAIQHLKDRGFKGSLVIKWEKGKIIDFEFTSVLKMDGFNRMAFDPDFFDIEQEHDYEQ